MKVKKIIAGVFASALFVSAVLSVSAATETRNIRCFCIF